MYGCRVVYDGFPLYPSEEAGKRDEDSVVLCDWESSTEEQYLKQGVDVPLDRPGTIVFEDGTTVIVRSGEPAMFTVESSDVALIEEWNRQMVERLRDAYDTGSKNR